MACEGEADASFCLQPTAYGLSLTSLLKKTITADEVYSVRRRLQN